MSKITTVRLPNASAQYDPQQYNQLVRSLEQIVLQLNQSYTPNVTEDQATAQTWAQSFPGAGGGFAGPTPGFQDSIGISLPFATFDAGVQGADFSIETWQTVEWTRSEGFYDVSGSPGFYYRNEVSPDYFTELEVPLPGVYLATFTAPFYRQVDYNYSPPEIAPYMQLYWTLGGTALPQSGYMSQYGWSYTDYTDPDTGITRRDYNAPTLSYQFFVTIDKPDTQRLLLRHRGANNAAFGTNAIIVSGVGTFRIPSKKLTLQLISARP